MKKVYINLTMSSSMFPPDCVIRKREIPLEEFNKILSEDGIEIISVLNKGHAGTLKYLWEVIGRELYVPDKPFRILLKKGERAITISLRGLPRISAYDSPYEVVKKDISPLYYLRFGKFAESINPVIRKNNWVFIFYLKFPRPPGDRRNNRNP